MGSLHLRLSHNALCGSGLRDRDFLAQGDHITGREREPGAEQPAFHPVATRQPPPPPVALCRMTPWLAGRRRWGSGRFCCPIPGGARSHPSYWVICWHDPWPPPSQRSCPPCNFTHGGPAKFGEQSNLPPPKRRYVFRPYFRLRK